MSCLVCGKSNVANDGDATGWSPDLVQGLFQQCLRANDGQLIVHGLFARANAVNNNMRLYPKRILKREVTKYVQEQIAGACALGELDHPSYSSPSFKHLNLVNVSHQVLSVKWKGNALWGFIHVLDTPSGRLLWYLYEKGYKLGVSSRGWATLKELPGKEYKCIMDNFQLITFDFVTEPSTRGAWLLPYAGKCPYALPRQSRATALSRIGFGAVPMAQLQDLPSPRWMRSFAVRYAAGQAECPTAAAVQRGEQRFPVKRMLSPKDWSAPRGPSAGNRGAKAKRREPEATDISVPGLSDAICPGMADGVLAAEVYSTRAQDAGRDAEGRGADGERGSSSAQGVMMVRVCRPSVLQFNTPSGIASYMQYGSYIVSAALFGVPNQNGNRDYWCHAFMFYERAARAAQVAAQAPDAETSKQSTPEERERELDDVIDLTPAVPGADAAEQPDATQPVPVAA